MTFPRLRRLPTLLLARALIGSLLIEILVSPPARKPVSTPLPARVPTHALVPARPRVRREPLSTLRAPTPDHRTRASALSTSNAHFPDAGWVTIPPPADLKSPGVVDHHRAAGWITTRAPLKPGKRA
ncbi:MAG: hypothetical protein ACLP1X_32430 [Polyangiaceae bacterium]